MNTADGTPHVFDATAADFLSTVVERSRATPVLVDFWAAWCGPCRALGPILEKLATEYAGGFALAKVDTEQEQALAAQFQIRSLPTVMLFKEGKVVTGFQGAIPEGQIRSFLTQHGVMAGGAPTLTLSADPVERVAQLRTAVADAPERDDHKLALALAILDTETSSADRDEASHLLEALPAASYTDARALRGRARLALIRRSQDGAGDARHTAAVRTVLEGEAASGLAQLLDLLRDEKGDENSPARAALIDALQMVDDEGLVRDTRRKMAALLF